MTDPQPHEAPHRAIDHEKTERQLKGLDGDALAEEHERVEQRPHEEVFEAPEGHVDPEGHAEDDAPPASDKKVTPT